MTDQDLLDLYNNSTHEIPGTENIRAVDFRMFKAAADIINHHAYKAGVERGMELMDNAVKTALNLVEV